MSYRAGTSGLSKFNLPDCEPHLVCDGCGTTRSVEKPNGLPYAWFLNWKKAPGWQMGRRDGKRTDYCTDCFEKLMRGAVEYWKFK